MSYREGYRDGYRDALRVHDVVDLKLESRRREARKYGAAPIETHPAYKAKRGKPKKRKLSDWNKFVKANSKKKRFIFQSGSRRGRLNLKKMGIAFRKTPAGRKKKR